MGQGSFFFFSFFFPFSFDEYYHEEEKMGWNDLAFLSVFFSLLSFSLVLGAQGGRMG